MSANTNLSWPVSMGISFAASATTGAVCSRVIYPAVAKITPQKITECVRKSIQVIRNQAIAFLNKQGIPGQASPLLCDILLKTYEDKETQLTSQEQSLNLKTIFVAAITLFAKNMLENNFLNPSFTRMISSFFV